MWGGVRVSLRVSLDLVLKGLFGLWFWVMGIGGLGVRNWMERLIYWIGYAM